MLGSRYDGNQDWVCPNIVLPEALKKCMTVFDVVATRERPRHLPELQPVFSECRVDMYFNKQKISITCDAVVATILSLFETPTATVRQSEIETKTGVKGMLLAAVMEELKTKQKECTTGLLQVPQS